MSYLILQITDSVITEKEYSIYPSLGNDMYEAVRDACGVIQNHYLMNNGEGVIECFLPNELQNANIFNNLLNDRQYITAFDFYCRNPFLNFRYEIVYGSTTYVPLAPQQLGKDFLLKKIVFQ